MILFWIVAALLMAGALLFVVPPLVRGRASASYAPGLTVAVYRDQISELDTDLSTGKLGAEAYAEVKRELELRLLEDIPVAPAASPGLVAPQGGRGVAIMVGVSLPLLAVAIYIALGTPSAVDPAQTAAAVAAAGQAPTPEQITRMVEQLAERLKQNPNDARGWTMLARSYSALERFPKAAEAYAKAAALAPNDAQLLADYAETLAIANGRNLNGKPTELLQAALKLDPNHQRSLALAGTAAFNENDYPAAIGYWERLQTTLPPGSDNARKIAAKIAEARAAAGQSAQSNNLAGSGVQAVAIGGTASLSPALAAQAQPTDTLFIFARAMTGTKMPLAVLRAQVKDLPKTFMLDDSMAMAPAMKLSNFQEVMVGARISKSGNATPQSGDLTGVVGPVKAGSRGVSIVIDGVVP